MRLGGRRELPLRLALCLLVLLVTSLPRTANGQGSDCYGAADVAFAVDSSGSIQETGDNWHLVINFVRGIVRRLDVGRNKIRVAAVRFSRNANVEFHLDEFYDKTSLDGAISRIRHSNAETNTAEGLRYLRTRIFQRGRGDRPGVPNIAIVVTDGQSNIGVDETTPEAERAKAHGIRLIAVGVTEQVNTQELRSIATDPTRDVITVEEFLGLGTILSHLVHITCPPGKHKNSCVASS